MADDYSLYKHGEMYENHGNDGKYTATGNETLHMIRSSIRSTVEDTRTRFIDDDDEGKTADYKRSQRIDEHEPGGKISRHSALQEDTGFSIVTQETDDIFKIFKQIHDWKS